MRRTLASVVVGLVLVAGCGGGSDDSNSGGEGSGGSDSSGGQSAGDKQYIDPFQDSAGSGACLSKKQVQEKVFRIAARVKNEDRKQKAIKAVRERAC